MYGTSLRRGRLVRDHRADHDSVVGVDVLNVSFDHSSAGCNFLRHVFSHAFRDQHRGVVVGVAAQLLDEPLALIPAVDVESDNPTVDGSARDEWIDMTAVYVEHAAI